MSISKKLYSVAEPLIDRLPGRTIKEKRMVFDTIIIALFTAFFLSPAPILLARHASTPVGAFLAVVLLLVLPIVFGKYLFEIIHVYGEEWQKQRRGRRQDIKQRRGNRNSGADQ